MLIDKGGAAPQVNHRKVNRGEPGCNVMTPLKDGAPVIENLPVAVASSSSSSLPALTCEQIEAEPIILSRYDGKANLRFALINILTEELGKKDRSISEVYEYIVEGFNSGLLLPGLRKEFGRRISWRTLYRYTEAFNRDGIGGLIPQYKRNALCQVTSDEKEFLEDFFLDGNKPKISDVIRECKRYLGKYSTSSPATLRRYIKFFNKHRNDACVFEREGEKAWNDKVAPYQDRDPMALDVGECIVADGHKLNLNVIDPITGKPKRAVLVLFWDWKSTYPLGWEIAFTENTQCITTALFNALLELGKAPSCIFIDNGRAFLSKIFTKKIVIGETQIPGMLYRIDKKLRYRHAPRYHAQSKPIERFFRILNDRLERRLPSYVGASIQDKPAYLLRNEPRAKALHNNWVPTVSQLNQILYQWREEYVDEPLPKRGGLTSREIFQEGRGEGLDPQKVYFLMMGVEIKTVRRCRFTFAGIDFESPCLYGYKGKILIRYSLSDLSKIYVFDPQDDRYMGVATQTIAAHPINDLQAAKRITAQRRMFNRLTRKRIDLARKNDFIIDGRKPLELLDYIETIDAEKASPEKTLSFLDEPESSKSVPEETDADRIDMMADHGSPLSGPFYSTLEEWHDWAIRQDPKDLGDADRRVMKEVENSPEYEKMLEDESFRRYLDRIKFKQPLSPEELRGEENEKSICANQIRE